MVVNGNKDIIFSIIASVTTNLDRLRKIAWKGELDQVRLGLLLSATITLVLYLARLETILYQSVSDKHSLAY